MFQQPRCIHGNELMYLLVQQLIDWQSLDTSDCAVVTMSDIAHVVEMFSSAESHETTVM